MASREAGIVPGVGVGGTQQMFMRGGSVPRSNPLPFYTAISRKVVGKNVRTTTPKGNMGYDQYTVPHDCSCRTYFCCFPLALANICPWPLVPFFQISLENRADKTTHNTFRDCRVHFFPTTFLETAVYHFSRKSSTPFVHLLLTNGTPFTYLV